MSPLIRIAVLTGLIAAIGVFAYIVLLHTLELNPFGRYKYPYIGLYGVFFVVGLYIFRQRHNRGYLRPQQGLLFGIVLNAVATLVYGAILLAFLQSDWGATAVLRYQTELVALLEQGRAALAQEIGKTSFEQSLAGVKAMTVRDLAIDQAFGLTLTGVFLTFLFMLIFKNNPPENKT